MVGWLDGWMVGWLDGWMVDVQSEWIDVKAGKLNALGNLIHHHYIIHLFEEILSSSFYPFPHSFPSPLHSIINFSVLIHFYFIHFPVFIHFHSYISLSLYTFIHTFPCAYTLSFIFISLCTFVYSFSCPIHFYSFISLC